MERMGDSLRVSNSHRSLEARVICQKKQSVSYLVASASKGLSQKTFKFVAAMKQRIQGNAAANEIVVFLLTTAALEVVRRFSRAICPFVWRALQALQIFSYPPFKWIERWDPFKRFIKHTKKLSRPMLVLSIATVFSDQYAWPTDTLYGSGETPESSVSRSGLSSQISGPDRRGVFSVVAYSDSILLLLDLSVFESNGSTITIFSVFNGCQDINIDHEPYCLELLMNIHILGVGYPETMHVLARVYKQNRSHDEVPGPNTSEQWLLDLHMELKKQGITVPERLSDDELHRFYDAVNGDFSKLLSSVKKTINWRQNYKLFPLRELEAWSHLVFWHGHDVSRRPCLIIRLGLACSTLGSDGRLLFIKAVVSQIEHGVVNLVNTDQPQIMVLMDCEGLSPFGFPLQMMRSCAMLLQDYYPNRLGCLIIIRLPQIARVITQALFQVLKPATRRKVKIVGKNYQKFLGEFLESSPSFLGGDCSCSKCSNIGTTPHPNVEFNSVLPVTQSRENDSAEAHPLPATNTSEDCDRLKRVIAVGVLMFCIFIIFMMGMHSEKLSNLY